MYNAVWTFLLARFLSLRTFPNSLTVPVHGQDRGSIPNCLVPVPLGRVKMVFWIFWGWVFASVAFGAEVANFQVGQKFQIILSNVIAVPTKTGGKVVPTDAVVFDIDAFETDASTIAMLQSQGKIVICYFSAGTYEPYRSDSGSFLASDKGAALPDWPDEYWLKVTSSNVRKIMTARIQMAASKGCNAIDPDNTGKCSIKRGIPRLGP